jgi:hypothetical protein
MSLFSNVAVFLAINHGGGARAYRISQWDSMQAKKVGQVCSARLKTVTDPCSQWFLFGSMNYTISVVPIKSSICVQLLRITSGIKRVYAYILYSVIALTTCTMIVRLVVWTTRCRPFAANWNPALGKCGSTEVVLQVSYFFSSVCILTDWVCAILPIFLLWNVQLSLRRKLQVGFVLSLGFL